MAASPTWHRDRTPPPFGRKRITAGAFSATSPDVKRPGHSQQHHSGPISGPFSETPAFGPASPNQAVIAARQGQRSFSSAMHIAATACCACHFSLRITVHTGHRGLHQTRPLGRAPIGSSQSSKPPFGHNRPCRHNGRMRQKTSAPNPGLCANTPKQKSHHTNPTHSNRLTRPNPKGHRQ